MTEGQALYRAIAERLGLDPDRRGVQTEILAYCDDIVTQPQLSGMKRGKGAVNPERKAKLCERFRVQLVPPSAAWGFVLVEGGEQ